MGRAQSFARVHARHHRRPRYTKAHQVALRHLYEGITVVSPGCGDEPTKHLAKIAALSKQDRDVRSGARIPITESMIQLVSHAIEVPLIIGGGITDPEKAYLNCKAGADVIVVGNAIEKDASLISEMASAIHQAQAVS